MGLDASWAGGWVRGVLLPDWRAERRGVPDCELRCRRCEGDDILCFDVQVIRSA